MKHSLNLLAVVGIIMSAMAVPDAVYANTAQSNWYMGLSGDLTWLRDSKTGGGGNIDLGYRFGDFRLEGEAGYHTADGENGASSTHYFTYMGNLYYDFNTLFPASQSGWHVAPYIGGGLGDAEVHFGSSSFVNTFHHNNSDFAYQGMAGLTFASASMPNTDWTVGYRYTGTDRNNIHAENLEAGLRFHF